MKKHVGRPSNMELRTRKNKLILTVAISTVFVFLVVGMFETGSISKLMGNSATDYYCEDGYELDGDKCVKTVKEKLLRIGDVNKDDKINTNDVVTIQRYLADSITLDDYQMTLADVNQDGLVNIADATIIQKYLSGSFSGSMAAENYIGNKTCVPDAKISRGYCYTTFIIDATQM